MIGNGLERLTLPGGATVFVPAPKVTELPRVLSLRKVKCGCRVWRLLVSCRYLRVDATLGEHDGCGVATALRRRRARGGSNGAR